MLKRILTLAFLLTSLWSTAQTEAVVFSNPGGFYDHSFYLTLSCQNPEHHIRYTTNGNAPTDKSALYDTPLFLDGKLYSKADIYKIHISPEDLVFIPDSVRHAIVIRAAVFDSSGKQVSETGTNTYLIHDLGCNTSSLAVLSICADSLDLFDYETGIMVPGAMYEASHPDSPGNYYQKGRDWERPVNLEFYEPDNNGINQPCGLRTHGNLSRRSPAKGMKFYAREEYGKDRFEHAFFGSETIDSFKHLVVKPFAIYWPHSGAQDYFCCTLALQLQLSAPHCRPLLVYLNGEYWGLYFLQEKMDEQFLEDHYGVDANHCNIIGDWKGEVEHGNGRNFKQMMKWLKKADLSNESDFNRACDLIDVDNFVDYMVFQTFVGNWDWPGNNMRCWQENDGPWRWLFFDGDATILQHDFDVFANAAIYSPPSTWSNYPEATLLFGKLLENDQFKATFKTRALELCDNPFLYANTSIILNDIIERLRPFIEDQRHRFGYPSSLNSWNERNALIEDFLRHRVMDYLNAMDAFPMLRPGCLLSDIDKFTCFPNPTNGEFKIQMSESWVQQVDVQIFNLTGQLIFHETRDNIVDNLIHMNLDLPAGVYIVKIGSHTQRLIKF